MDLVERQGLLADLRAELATAASSGGRFVFLAGIAGIGKTSVVRALADAPGTPTRVMVGACDALSTPRPLGPLHDVAAAEPAVAELLRSSGDRHTLFSGLRDELTNHPSLLVIEDAHWADDAMLDLLRYLGRRITGTRSLVVTTYRSGELHASHPLRGVLGDLATAAGHRRLEVEPLSRDGVGELAAHRPVDAAHLHQITGGNPFYVTEVLAAPGWTVPPTVADAVAARAGRLTPPARAVLDSVSIEPSRTELDLLDHVGHSRQAVDEALTSGMLVAAGGGAVRFRHELARLAISESLAPARRHDLHVRVLGYLAARAAPDAARLAHHAGGAGDDAAVLHWATVAGRSAASNGAHREAVAHYRDAVAAAESAPPDPAALAEILAAYAVELKLQDRPAEALAVRRRIVELQSAIGSPTDVVVAGVALAAALWTAGDGDAAREHMNDLVGPAIDLDDSHAASHALAAAGYISMLSRAGEEAIDRCDRAVALADAGGFDDVLVRALNALGSTRIACFDDMHGIEELERSARIAERHGWDTAYCDALENLGSALGEVRALDQAAGYLERAVQHATERDLDSHRHYATAWLARVWAGRGQWDRALDAAASVPHEPGISPISPIMALPVVALVRARRGQPVSTAALETAWDLARQTNDVQRLWPVVAARAEQAWLAGSPSDAVVADVLDVLGRAEQLGMRWAIGELAFWSWKLGAGDDAPAAAADPYRLHLAGRAGEAAEAWEAIGDPYMRAWALADTGDEASLRTAFDILVDLGATPLADRVRHSLRALRATNIPARPRAARAEHPAGLTPRQAEVLGLLAEGLSDRQIAERMFITPKTAGHHVSAILRTLGVASRAEAAARAARTDWFGDHRD